uniref:Uncharacterized protein n=1 Tax=Sphaerodactylus townsendi TaxID=933632 RepID=A0ACB8G6M6_9SAUR
MSVYTFLRLIVDHHGSPPLQALRQKEVDFCISLLRDRFMDCAVIGRDLVRLLQNVARIPEFEQLWKDIIHNPQALSPQFTVAYHSETAQNWKSWGSMRQPPSQLCLSTTPGLAEQPSKSQPPALHSAHRQRGWRGEAAVTNQ